MRTQGLITRGDLFRQFTGLRNGLLLTYVDDDTFAIGSGAAQFTDGSFWTLAGSTNYTFAILDTGARAAGKD